MNYTTMQQIGGAFLVIAFFALKNTINTYLTKIQSTFAFSEALIQSANVFKNIAHQNELFFRNSETGALIGDIMYVPTAFSNGIILGYITLLTELSVLILMLLFLAFSSLYVSLLVLLFVAPAAFFSYQSIKTRVEELGKYRNSNVQQAQDALVQSLQAHTDAVIYNRVDYFKEFFISFEKQISATDAQVFTLNSMPARLMELFAVVAFCLLYIYSKHAGIESTLPFSITLFVASAFRLLPSINRSLSAMLRIKNHWFSIDTLRAYKKINPLNQEPDVIEFKNHITLKNIEFDFAEKTICKINFFELKKGSCIGIFGNTGEGKSTFLQLMLHLIPAKKGSFWVDDVLIEKDQSSSYQQLFSYIKQDVFILNASLQENISLSREADSNKVLLDDIINKLELNKLKHLLSVEDSNAGEAGNKLSGGQKKLIALARALYFEKPILVIDEALASLDHETTQQVLQILKLEHKKGKTIIIVSHQRNVFDICETIYEFKNGTLSNHR